MSEPSDHYVKKREPFFTGEERPLPDFGLVCGRCNQSLAGAQEGSCPHCGGAFDLEEIMPTRDWFNVASYVPDELLPQARGILYENNIPYVVNDAGLREVYGGAAPYAWVKVLVPEEFFLDAMHAFVEVSKGIEEPAEEEWICDSCGEKVPGNFTICWNCGSRQNG